MKTTSYHTRFISTGITALTLAVSCLTAGAQILPPGAICYDLEAKRFFEDSPPLPPRVGFDTFSATSNNPLAPPLDVSGVTFDFTFTGVPPVQSLTGPMAITWNSSETFGVTADLTGLPSSIMVGSDEYLLCHVCWDFTFDAEDVDSIKLIDGNGNTILNEGKGFYDDISGPVTIVSAADQKITVGITDIQACYCLVPEPSTFGLSLLSVAGFLLRRKR